jgi:hypothetical protein
MNRMEFSRTARVPFSKCYGNFFGGGWAGPAAGRYLQNHPKTTLDHHQQAKNMLVGCGPRKLGFF